MEKFAETTNGCFCLETSPFPHESIDGGQSEDGHSVTMAQWRTILFHYASPTRTDVSVIRPPKLFFAIISTSSLFAYSCTRAKPYFAIVRSISTSVSESCSTHLTIPPDAFSKSKFVFSSIQDFDRSTHSVEMTPVSCHYPKG